NLVAEIVRATPLFQQAAGHHQLKTELMDRDVWLDVDINALNTAVMNLLVNAKHAMETPGQIRLALELTHEESTLRHLHTDEQRGPYFVRLVVEDEGSGIAAENLDRIFEPYFTTKEAGKGTGLGLSMVYGFMTQIGGKVHVESEAGKGTQFFLYFPGVEISEMKSDTTSSEQTIKESIAPASHRPIASNIPGAEGPRSVLLVDDNDDVRFISKVYLESAGFTVVESVNGAEALDLLADEHNEFLLLITDMIMPGEVTGRVLIEEARRLRPSLPAGVVSGYSDELLAMSDSGEPIELLRKPFSKQQMIDFAESMLKAAR
ncbi:MAG: ATP-binding protein, partial [Pseudomonadota bacterium]|nr:ATP-binding protein [Pseudomonadota bacterium]